MKVPKPRKLSSGNWFIQLRLGGESVPVTAPTERECTVAAELIKAEHRAGKREANVGGTTQTLSAAIDKYINSRSSSLSPATIRGYNIIKNNRFQSVTDKRIKDIKDWQKVCDEEAKKCSPKTLRNAWSFVSTVLRKNGVRLPEITLPQVISGERPFLEPEQIETFLLAIEGTDAEISALLALHSLRVSEICALTWENHIDLKKSRIRVSGAVVPDKDNNLVTKETNKNNASQRYVPIMIDRLYLLLSDAKNKSGPVINTTPTAIYKQINRICEKHELPLVGVHGLRHSFASLAYHLEMPEKIAMQIGGWADQATMHKIYTHLVQRDVSKYETKMTDFYKNANNNANNLANNEQ